MICRQTSVKFQKNTPMYHKTSYKYSYILCVHVNNTLFLLYIFFPGNKGIRIVKIISPNQIIKHDLFYSDVAVNVFNHELTTSYARNIMAEFGTTFVK